MPVTAEQLIAIERQVAASIFEVDDLRALEEMRARARALEQYLRDKELQGPMLGVQRRLEARIGQLLGKAEPTNQSAVSHEIRQIERRNDRLDFRILAHALNGDCQLQDAEWRKSRRALISLIRNRMGLLPEMEPLPEGVFRCIVADPPWQQTTGSNAWNAVAIPGDNGALAYEQLSIEQIKGMNVLERAADDAHLYLWTINKYVEQSYEVARAWGFNPSTLLVWAKTPHGVGLGGAFRITTEFVLYARRGHLKESKICETTWFNWPRGIHSRKPDEFYRLIESMTPAPRAERDRLDLFARRERAGWTVWGDEVSTPATRVVSNTRGRGATTQDRRDRSRDQARQEAAEGNGEMIRSTKAAPGGAASQQKEEHRAQVHTR
jgi:N6-adenosine-specific RNA methylase IME4